jgi:nicotinamidase-related amidase
VESIRGKSFYSQADELIFPSRTALIMYDPLAQIVTSGTGIVPLTMLETWVRLLGAARRAKVHVIYALQVPDWNLINGPWLRYLARTRPISALEELAAGGSLSESPGNTEFISMLEPASGESIFAKTFNDGFAHTDLSALLRSSGIETIVLSGFASDTGISGTARRAPSEGFYPVVVTDCVGAIASRKKSHEAAVEYLQLTSDCMTADEVIAIWSWCK